MPRHKKILAAVDGSEAGFHVLKESIRLAQWGRGGVTAIAVAPSYEGDLSLVGVKNPKAAIFGRSEAVLARAVEIAEALGVRIEVICEEGEPHEKIAGRARAFDCVAMGAGPGKGFLARLIPGVSAKVAAISTADVLIVPQGKALCWDRMLFASDARAESAGFAASAQELARSYEGMLQRVPAPNGPQPGKRAAKGICAAAADLDPGVIVIGSDQMTRLRRFGGSQLQRIVELSQRPVYVIKVPGASC
jgi:nucleotide-binding universal stress UspA family protein